MDNYKAKASGKKKQIVQELVQLFKENDIVGVANMKNLPAKQLQGIKANLREKLSIYMTKKRLMKIALQQIAKEKPELAKIEAELKGMPALIFTKENPFTLFNTLKKNKTPAPAKAGQEAPRDIIIPAGQTSFAPGPVIGELGALGIKSGVEGGKIVIKSDATVAKEGDVISAPLASMLTRLNINPMEIGLNVSAIYGDRMIYTKAVLDIDEEEYINNLITAAGEAINLAIEIGYPTKDTIELLLQQAFRQSKGLALETNFLADAVVEELLSKAERQAISLKEQTSL
jgi:large subunit ribosomal protein L10